MTLEQQVYNIMIEAGLIDELMDYVERWGGSMPVVFDVRLAEDRQTLARLMADMVVKAMVKP